MTIIPTASFLCFPLLLPSSPQLRGDDAVENRIQPAKSRANDRHGHGAEGKETDTCRGVELAEDGVRIEAVVGVAQLDPPPVGDGDAHTDE